MIHISTTLPYPWSLTGWPSIMYTRTSSIFSKDCSNFSSCPFAMSYIAIEFDQRLNGSHRVLNFRVFWAMYGYTFIPNIIFITAMWDAFPMPKVKVMSGNLSRPSARPWWSMVPAVNASTTLLIQREISYRIHTYHLVARRNFGYRKRWQKITNLSWKQWQEKFSQKSRWIPTNLLRNPLEDMPFVDEVRSHHSVHFNVRRCIDQGLHVRFNVRLCQQDPFWRRQPSRSSSCVLSEIGMTDKNYCRALYEVIYAGRNLLKQGHSLATISYVKYMGSTEMRETVWKSRETPEKQMVETEIPTRQLKTINWANSCDSIFLSTVYRLLCWLPFQSTVCMRASCDWMFISDDMHYAPNLHGAVHDIQSPVLLLQTSTRTEFTVGSMPPITWSTIHV